MAVAEKDIALCRTILLKFPPPVFGLFKPKNPEEHRYYLLPGMGRSNRRQRQFYFRCAIVFGIFVALIVGTVIYLSQRPGPGLFK